MWSIWHRARIDYFLPFMLVFVMHACAVDKQHLRHQVKRIVFHFQDGDLVVSEQRYCPSYCDASGKLFDETFCVTVQTHCCKFSNSTLGCCKNHTLAVGDTISSQYNCDVPLLETWEIVLAVCIPIATLSFLSFFIMLSFIIVKRKRSNQQQARARSNSSRSCSSCSSYSTTSPTTSSNHSMTSRSNVSNNSSTSRGSGWFSRAAGRRAANRRDGSQADPVKPPPYVKNPPNYKDIYVITVNNIRVPVSSGDFVDDDVNGTLPPEYYDVIDGQDTSSSSTLNVVQLFQRNTSLRRAQRSYAQRDAATQAVSAGAHIAPVAAAAPENIELQDMTSSAADASITVASSGIENGTGTYGDAETQVVGSGRNSDDTVSMA